MMRRCKVCGYVYDDQWFSGCPKCEADKVGEQDD